MNRRSFIRLSLLAIPAAIAAYLLLNFDKVVKRILIADTQSLKVPDEAIDRFLNEAKREHFWNKFSFSKKMFICVQHFFSSLGIKLKYHTKYVQYRSMITGQFLLSTDFFLNKMDPSKDVTYIGFFNPYKTGCSNPFSSLRFTS
ncbi:MAG TPA: hypothetical protein VIN08_27660 [Ohtaekwangia sp.]|uniref:hypothetical protein n=1 Tax=Ohtaekwangia sp. TaxID=2066019 RepID=UPI002F91D733